MEGTKKRAKIITITGYKYEGEIISQNNSWVEINDIKDGPIQIPLVNISYMKVGGKE